MQMPPVQKKNVGRQYAMQEPLESVLYNDSETRVSFANLCFWARHPPVSTASCQKLADTGPW